MDDFNIAINRSVLININGNKSQKSCEHITRAFSVQASCVWVVVKTQTQNRISAAPSLEFIDYLGA